MRGRLPPPALALPLARRLAVIWAAGRGLLLLLGVGLTAAGPHVLMPPLAAGLLVFEVRRRGEDLLLANLGFSLRALGAAALAGAILLEAAGHLAAAAAGAGP